MIGRLLLAALMVAPLSAQRAPELGTAGLSVTVAAYVDIQLQDAQGRLSGMDFGTGHPRRDLPNSIYEPNEGISDDETGEPDPDPNQCLELGILAPGDYILRIRSSREAAATVYIDVSDRRWQSVRRTIQIQPGQIAQVLEYRLHVDPMAASALEVRPVVRTKP